MMTFRPRRIMRFQAVTLSQWALAFSLATCVGTLAQAANVGHARITSVYGEPLQIIVPLNSVTQQESASLHVTLADASAWKMAGLVPPVSLESLRITVRDDSQPGRKNIIVTSTQPLKASTVDVLLNLQTGASRRQIQVTLLVPQRLSAASPVQPARLLPPAAPGRTPATTVNVGSGENLLSIARRYAIPDATDFQMVVAIWRANPKAFIQNNMNLVRAGDVLRIPSPSEVRAIDERQAQQIYLEQADAFADYRSRIAAQVRSVKAAGEDVQKSTGQLTAAPSASAPLKAPAEDRLKLSTADSPETQAKDAHTSGQHAIKEAELRLQALQANVDALNQAAAASSKVPATPAAPIAGTTPERVKSDSLNASALPQVAANKTDLPGMTDSASANNDSGKKDSAVVANAQDKVSTEPSTSSSMSSEGDSLPTRDTLGSEEHGWFANNMLVIVTAGLALIVLIIAWLMRLAGGRRADESEGEGGSDQSDVVFDEAVIARQLDDINLDLKQTPPSDASDKASRG